MTFGVMLPPSNLPPHFPQPGFDPIVELEAALIAKDEIIARLRPKLAKVEGASLLMQSGQDINVGGRGAAAQYQYSLTSESLNAP